MHSHRAGFLLFHLKTSKQGCIFLTEGLVLPLLTCQQSSPVGAAVPEPGTCPALPLTPPPHSQGLLLWPPALDPPLGIIMDQQHAHHLGRNFLGEVTKAA